MSHSHSMSSLMGLGLSLLLFAAPLAHAQVQTNGSGDVFYLGGNHTIDSGHSVTGSAYVGINTSGFSVDSMNNFYHPTVNLVSGGSVGNSAIVAGNSTFNMSGGSIQNDLVAADTSTVNLSGGSVGEYLEALGDDTINVTGGSIGSDIYVANNGIINFFGTGFTYKFYKHTIDDDYSFYYFSGTLDDGTAYLRHSFFIENNGRGATIGQHGKVNLVDAASGVTTTLGADGSISVAPTVSSVPEPGIVALLAAFGSVGSGLLLRRRARK